MQCSVEAGELVEGVKSSCLEIHGKPGNVTCLRSKRKSNFRSQDWEQHSCEPRLAKCYTYMVCFSDRIVRVDEMYNERNTIMLKTISILCVLAYLAALPSLSLSPFW